MLFANLTGSPLVVQCRLGPLWCLHHVHQVVSSMALPTSLRTPEMESLGHSHRLSSRGNAGILHQYNYRQDPRMYPEGANF